MNGGDFIVMGLIGGWKFDKTRGVVDVLGGEDAICGASFLYRNQRK